MRMPSLFTPAALLAGSFALAGCARQVNTAAAPSGAGVSASAATTAVSSKPAGLPATATAQVIQQGDSIFNNGSCKRCHGMNGTNGRTAPDLTDATWLHIDGSYDSIVHIITTGVPAAEFKSPTSRFPMRPKGGMPLTDDQVAAVAAYVYTLSHH
jgi:mono/diheme cytochrome c family protein